MPTRIWLVAPAAAVLTACACMQSSGADEWPVRPVRVIVPFGAGTSSDLVARLYAPLLAERWQRAIVVDNLLFIKYVSDTYAGPPYGPITIPPGASFKKVALQGKPDIGDQIDQEDHRPTGQHQQAVRFPGLQRRHQAWHCKEMVDGLTTSSGTSLELVAKHG